MITACAACALSIEAGIVPLGGASTGAVAVGIAAAFGDAVARLGGLRPRVRSWYVLALESIPGFHPYGRKRNVLLVMAYLIVAAIIAGFVV